MGKKHDSQYANFGWLRFELPEFIKLEKLLETYISSGFSFLWMVVLILLK